VGAVGIHFDEYFVAFGEAPVESCEVCAAEAVFDGAVQYVDLGVFGCHVVGDLSGAVGTVVVDNEDIDFGGCLAQALHYDRKVFFFIVCGNNGEYAHKSP
jgi:hypothetical protein